MPRAREPFVVACVFVALAATSPATAEEDAPGLPAVLPESLAALPTLPDSAADAPVGEQSHAAGPPASEGAPYGSLPAGQEPTPAPSPPVPEPPPPGAVRSPAASARSPRAETEITIDRGTGVAAGVGFGGPLGAAASVRLLHGLAADVREADGRVKALCALPIPHCAQGFLVQAEAGSGGGKVSLGVGARARVEEDDFRGTVGASLRASLVRTWGSPLGTEPGLTYLGPELDLSILRLDLTLGVLWRASGNTGASVLFSWGVGLGL